MINLEIIYKGNNFSYKGINFDIRLSSFISGVSINICNIDNNETILELNYIIPDNDIRNEIQNIKYETRAYLHKLDKISEFNRYKKQYKLNIDIYNYFEDFFKAKFITNDFFIDSHKYGTDLLCNSFKILDPTVNEYIEYNK